VISDHQIDKEGRWNFRKKTKKSGRATFKREFV